MVLPRAPGWPSRWPVAIAEALAVVTVGKSEWLFSKSTPSARTAARAGATSGVTLCERRPSATKMMTLRASAGAAQRLSAAASMAENLELNILARPPATKGRTMARLDDSSAAQAPGDEAARMTRAAPAVGATADSPDIHPPDDAAP